MLKKLTLIIFLAIGLIALLFYEPWISKEVIAPRVADRLPNADVIGKTSILSLTKSLSSVMYYHKTPFREFLSPEFILSQGKAYGLNVQEPIFFFMNQNEWEYYDFGLMIHVSDSSLILDGIDKVDKLLGVENQTIGNQKVYKITDKNVFFSYGSDWFVAYQGERFEQVLKHITSAKLGSVTDKWKTFLSNPTYNNATILAKFDFAKLRMEGIESGLISLSNDSTSVTLNTSITQLDTLSFYKKESGLGYVQSEYTNNLINLHFNVDRLRNNKNSPLYKIIQKFGAKISFPTQDFFNAWTGNIAYRQGGLQTITERYITSELDDDFNVTEVVKYRKVKVSAFTLNLSMNENREELLSKLFDRGILTKDGRKYRLLFSPPLKMNLNSDALIFHTSKFLPEVYPDSSSTILWTYNYTPYQLTIDSTSSKTMYSRLSFPLKKIIENKIPSDNK